MAEAELQTVQIRDDFYRDSFGKLIFIIASISLAIILLIALSIYLHYQKPAPVVFPVDKEGRVKAEVALDQPYLDTADVLQWVGGVVPKLFVLDFYHYNDQVKTFTHYFTDNGWKVFLNQLNIHANYNNVQANKLFISAEPAGAPFILNEGLLIGRYGWWVQIPVKINYIGPLRTNSDTLNLQLLIIRVPTLNNLSGVGIDNVIVAKDKEATL